MLPLRWSAVTAFPFRHMRVRERRRIACSWPPPNSGERAELIVSGINYGPNLADDINYSGTVAGAVEACLLGIPALAVSLACDYERRRGGPHWKTAAEIVRRCIERGYETFSDIRYYWNLQRSRRCVRRDCRYCGDALGA